MLRATVIPGVAVPISLIGTFGVMYLLRLQPRQPVADGAHHLDRLRGGRRDRGDREHHPLPRSRACRPSRRRCAERAEIGFTVLSISISLVAVFIPILLMGGIVGRLFREFAVTLSIAIVVSMVVSLTTTPMMCAKLLRPETDESHGSLLPRRASASSTARWLDTRCGLSWVLRHSRLTLAIAARDARTQRLPVLGHSEGLLPAAGHRAPDGRDPGRSGHLVPGDARSADASSSASSRPIRPSIT